jgi:CubicO group peptidase (beta-lactamase class C family)
MTRDQTLPTQSGLLLAVALTACAGPRLAGPGATPPLAFDAPDRAARLAAAATAELEPALAAAAAEAGVPGAAMGLVAGGRLVWFKGVGVQDVATRAPVDQDTVFRIASMTKAFVAAAALQLRDEGKLALDDPAERYLPELRGLQAATTDAPRITVRHLLSHASGLPEDNATADLRMPAPEADLDQLLASGLSFSTAPGTRYEYSNLGFALAGRVVARAGGQRLQEQVTQRLLQPLGMSATRWDASLVPETHRAHGYGRRGSEMPSPGLDRYTDDAPHEEPVLADGAWAPIGGLWTSPRDYARWVALQLAATPARSEPEAGPVRRSSLREAQEVQRTWPFTAERSDEGGLQVGAGGYGLGWGVGSTCSFPKLVTHGGGLPGYGSLVVLLPEQDLGLFTMTNLTYTNLGGVARGFLARLQARGLLPTRPVTTSPQLERARADVLDLLGTWDPARAAALFDANHGAYEAPGALQARLAAFSRTHGACRGAPGDAPVNALRGRLHLSCERGDADLSLELTSDLPPRLQTLVLESALPPSPALTQAALALAGPPDEAATKVLFSRAADAEGARRALRKLALNQGVCSGPRPVRGDGATRATFRLACERGEAEVTVTLEPATGKVTGVTAGPVPGTLRCPR